MNPNNAMQKVVFHPDCDEIISKLAHNVDVKNINNWLKDKYEPVGDISLIIGTSTLKKFKDEYLDVYKTIKKDALSLKESNDGKVSDPSSLANSNGAYRKLLESYAEQELDIKQILKESIAVMRSRIEQIYDIIQENPKNTKPDYILVQWINNLNILLEKSDAIINGSSDKIVQQNNINIQVLDQHAAVFQNVYRRIIDKLKYEDSMMLISILNEEVAALKPINMEEVLPIDVRLKEAQKIESLANIEFDILK